MGHVSNNIGGVYEYYKTYDQDGAIYTPVPKEKQENAMKFIQDELFTTPEWLIDQEIFNRIEFDGNIERIRGYQVRTLNNILDFGRMARLLENEEVNGSKAYGLLDMMTDLREGLFNEVRNGKTINRYRRNLQRAYIERLEMLMTEEQSAIPAAYRRYVSRSNIDVSQSDIRPVVRGELETLQGQVKRASNRTGDKMTKYHLKDLAERIDLILNPITKP